MSCKDISLDSSILDIHRINTKTTKYIVDKFAYADDLAICVYSIGELHKAIKISNKWSNEASIPINFRKNGILNIIKNINTYKIVIGDDHMNQ